MIPEIEKGKLLFQEREEIYKRNILLGKIPFYFFILLPIFLPIFIILFYRITKFLLLGILPLIVAVFILSRWAFANKLTIYEHGYTPPITPVTMRFKKETPFIKYSDITRVAIQTAKGDTTIINMIGITDKNGTIFPIERKDVDEITLSQLVNILKEKLPDKIEENIRAGI